jgi:hypothetical protein
MARWQQLVALQTKKKKELTISKKEWNVAM